ncbi:SDR family NAD(P)-dependent oxidoreductase [Lentilactobacillus sunkii]|uniref:Oxidoreductase, short chain dehydrogenase reductase family protein n=1 Tax=Lentilactobacillus sunkii DSM 19904 TaxID=1423808 RepID=A0A0R1L7X2_9LACO|nr:SDR family NAD(P)-dependent oxidoreductase [Lentilactobacillus sunkii]KRK87639.1 oxidoreductase, short chain dehydrogenase reductase family protein [Lentilactobacillus sunkii DSM 19904]
MKVAIITGSSSGLGKEFVEAVVDTKSEIEEIWLIARRKELLQKIADNYYTKSFKIFPLDLTNQDDLNQFEERIQEEHPDVKLLINNAGMLDKAAFASQSPAKQKAMVELNAEAPTLITRMILPFMTRGSSIINTCSVTSYTPVPKMDVYAATKSYLYFLSIALREELKAQGINVLALCPGNMRTELFLQSDNQNKKKSIIDQLPFLDMKTMTRKSIRFAEMGHGVYTPGTFYKGYRVMAKLIPFEFFDKFAKV